MNGFQKRILVPLAVPVGATLVAVVLVFNFSRVLLALEERRSAAVATVAAILAAVGVLAGCAFFASRRQARTAGLAVLATAAFLLMFGGGYGLGATSAKEGGGGEGEAAAGGKPAAEVTIVAKDPFMFVPKEVTAPAGEVKMTLENQGAIIHTLEFENLPGFRKMLVSGTSRRAPGKGTVETHTVKLKPGTYVFFCSESGHRGSGMEGKLKVS
jgi:plastocyanin